MMFRVKLTFLFIISNLYILSSYAINLNYVAQYPDNRHIAWAKNNQGVSHDEENWFISQQDYLWKIHKSIPLSSATSTNHPLISKVGIPSHLKALGYNHFGDIDYFKGLVYVPLEGKSGVPNILLTFDADTLKLEEEYLLPLAQYHFSWVAVNPKNRLIYTSEFNPMKKDGILAYKITGKKLKLVKSIMPSNSKGEKISFIKRVQGGVFDPEMNLLLLSCDHKNGGIIALDEETFKFKFIKKIKFSPDFPKYEELEGITVWRNSNAPHVIGDVHIMMLDNDLNDDDEIYMKHFEYVQKDLK